jgi:hypothetical protein
MKKNQTSVMFLLIAFIMISCRKESVPPVKNQQELALQQSTATGTGLLARCGNAGSFVEEITNPYLPFDPGTTKWYVSKTIENGNRTVNKIRLDVTHDTKLILGVKCTVVHVQTTEDGTLIEDAYDWYAQDRQGNVWNFGESTKDISGAGVDSSGSWEAGVDGAKQGIAMYAHPADHLGETYYEEYYANVAEDLANLINSNSTISIRFGRFMHCVQLNETSRLHPGEVSKKSYAPGLGEILSEITIPGGHGRQELVAIRRER